MPPYCTTVARPSAVTVALSQAVTAGTPAGTNSSVSAGTPAGTNSAPTFTGSSLSVTPAYAKVIFCKAD